jgi:hypothetical protein
MDCSSDVNAPDSTTSVERSDQRHHDQHPHLVGEREDDARRRERQIEGDVRPAPAPPVSPAPDGERRDHGPGHHGGKDQPDLARREALAVERRPEEHGAEPVCERAQRLSPQDPPGVGRESRAGFRRLCRSGRHAPLESRTPNGELLVLIRL